MKRCMRRITVLLSIIWLAFIAACSLTDKPSVVIISPPSGSQFFEGEDIAVQSATTDKSGVVRVELVVDGAVARVDPSPTAQGQPNFTLIQTWKATPGVHTILVRAYNASGAVSDPAGVSVNVMQRTAQAPTLTPTIPSVPPLPGITPPAPIPPTVTPSPTSPPPGPSSCTNNAVFVQDVTVPAGTNWAAGQAFNKIWQVRNTGTCTWTGYQLVFAGGEAMTTNSTAAVPSTAPGATADILVPMTAPSSAGTHAGQWRLQSPSGLFGPTLAVSIIVVGGGGNPPSGGCSGTPNIASFTSSAASVTAGNPVTLSWGAVTNAESAEIDHGIGGIETPGSRVVNPTVYTTYTLTARCGANVATKQVTIAVLAPPIAVPPAPSLSSPADGWVFRNFPRTATFTWNTVSAPGTVAYNIEIQINTGTWQNKVTQTGIAGTSYAMSAFSGDNQGRWRVWATSSTAGEGAKSDWRAFSFNTSASQYSGTWLNDDSGTSGVTRIIISNSGQTLNVHPYGKCSPTDCDWGTKSQAFNGEPFVIGGFPSGGSHQLTITLNNPAGTSLKAVDFNGTNTFTYYFHK